MRQSFGVEITSGNLKKTESCLEDITLKKRLSESKLDQAVNWSAVRIE